MNTQLSTKGAPAIKQEDLSIPKLVLDYLDQTYPDSLDILPSNPTLEQVQRIKGQRDVVTLLKRIYARSTE